jgi:hypothetical protein
MITTLSNIQQTKTFTSQTKIHATKWRMDINKYGYWKPHVSNSLLLSGPKVSRAVKAVKNYK